MNARQIIPENRDPYVIARKLFEVVRAELLLHKNSAEYLSRDEAALLLRYYGNTLRKNPARQSHYFAQRIKNVVKLLLYGKQPRILDCGCGFGTESLIFALLGGKVLGVDLNSERLGVAKKRIDYYRKLNPQLQIDFKLCNILKYKCSDAFDIVYAKEFISHVHPVPKFIEFAHKCLKDGGYLILHDTNPLNPLSRYRAWKEHRCGLYKFVKDPETGENVTYAVERLVSTFTLKQLLSTSGFRVVGVNFYVWPGPNLLLPIISFIEAKLKIPVTSLYEIIAMKT